ncbi:hypothetical protein THASP1DRAFT_21727 [Thamnocephalis sphaerospora]|uniref:Uncharacterized protein n=1 Tax=Thamnocephalis sphaerospora TaxID=78915 RepID=A0A4V1IXC8_9FUNG|nr:hypothetical protein THASP1DRAFT_21727 [Thamnocephalis sphaerospora]|eukprot:RKP10609.1 hypothetical protein THASP1DRAFT_21727 [Thamnocephalis sphaerospora]
MAAAAAAVLQMQWPACVHFAAPTLFELRKSVDKNAQKAYLCELVAEAIEWAKLKKPCKSIIWLALEYIQEKGMPGPHTYCSAVDTVSEAAAANDLSALIRLQEEQQSCKSASNDQTNKTKAGSQRKFMNCYMLYSKYARKLITSMLPSALNGIRSTILGRTWREERSFIIDYYKNGYDAYRNQVQNVTAPQELNMIADEQSPSMGFFSSTSATPDTSYGTPAPTVPSIVDAAFFPPLYPELHSTLETPMHVHIDSERGMKDIQQDMGYHFGVWLDRMRFTEEQEYLRTDPVFRGQANRLFRSFCAVNIFPCFNSADQMLHFLEVFDSNTDVDIDISTYTSMH